MTAASSRAHSRIALSLESFAGRPRRLCLRLNFQSTRSTRSTGPRRATGTYRRRLPNRPPIIASSWPAAMSSLAHCWAWMRKRLNSTSRESAASRSTVRGSTGSIAGVIRRSYLSGSERIDRLDRDFATADRCGTQSKGSAPGTSQWGDTECGRAAETEGIGRTSQELARRVRATDDRQGSASIGGDFDLPARASIEFEVSWKTKPDFVLAFGVNDTDRVLSSKRAFDSKRGAATWSFSASSSTRPTWRSCKSFRRDLGALT